ncbi:MAG: hypothetical protein JNK16_03990 [Phycisphaerales bacterium]|nr:hypothetical protein [Phycisphaerales bacterium]
MKRSPRIIAAALGCSAFAIACVSGLAAHNPSNVVLTRALWALVACYIAGLILGTIGEVIVAQHIENYAKKNPVPDVMSPPKEPVLIAELAEDQSGAGLPSGASGAAQLSQVAQASQSAPANRKAA